MQPWEHAACTGLARSRGWVGDDDWWALRTQALGASARGTDHVHDERLIAGARIWLAFVDDPAASRIVMRPTVRHDPLAVALDLLASRLSDDPHALQAVELGTGSSVPVAPSPPRRGILPA
jgi:hypothetical protein